MLNRFRLYNLFLFVFTVFFLNRPLSSEEKKFTQRIEWKADKSAYEYRVELKSGEKSTMYTTDKTSIELHLQAGKYSYRIFVYDFLGRQATVSEWKSFEIVKASTPKISLDESESITADEEGNIELAIDIANISANSVIELVSDSIVGSFVIEGNKKSVSEVEKVSKVQFANVPAGKWKIRVTNPSGLSSESEDTITVIEKPVVSAEEPSENAATEDTEKTKTVSDEQSEITDESEDKEEEKEIAEEETEKVPQIAETEEEQPDTFTKQPEAEPVAEKKKKVKTPKPPKPPYICKDIHIMAGYRMPFCVMNTLSPPQSDVFQSPNFSFILPDIYISYFPKKSEKNRFGLELSFSQTSFDYSGESEFYKAELDTMLFSTSFVYQHTLFSQKTFLSLKAGLGTMTINKSAEYTVSADGRENSSSSFYAYPALNLGFSLFAIPLKYICAEAGLHYTHILIDRTKQTIFLSPYFALGFRL